MTKGKETGLEKHRSTFFQERAVLLFLPYELNLDLLNPAHLLQDIFFVFDLLGERMHSVNLLMTYHAYL